jgi:phage protein U
MMMILGMFVFSIPTATYQSLQRSTAWNHASNSRVGSMPAYQYVGKGKTPSHWKVQLFPSLASSYQLLHCV